MMQKVTLKLESDFISCGINTEDNFMESREYIPGGVIAAGIAKDIYLSCPIAKRDNFIELKDAEGKCKDCENMEKCRQFSDMRFSCFYKENYQPAPLTTQQCKVNPKKHPLKDIILANGAVKCKECEAIDHSLGRMDSAKGYIDIKSMRCGKVKKNLFTHTAIDYNTHTALKGSLYSVRAISRGQIFTGYIDDLGLDIIKKGTVIYAGKMSSSGCGKLMVEKVEPTVKPAVNPNDIIKFTETYGGNSTLRKDEQRYYCPILFLSDAMLGFEFGTEAKSTEEYKEMWRKALFGETDIFRIENVYAQNALYGGYDTSRKWGDWRKQAEIITLKGSSVLMSFDKSELEKAVDVLDKMLADGIGENTSIGYGAIDVCNKLHMLGVANNE